MLMDAITNPGPLKDIVLYDQEKHVSSAVWDGQERGALRCHEHTSKLSEWKLNSKQIELVERAGFGYLRRIPPISLDNPLISALVERWRRETNTFHFTIGEMTVTLEDITLFLGLGIDGKPVIGVTYTTCSAVCERYLGQAPDSMVKLSWLKENFSFCPEDASFEEVESTIFSTTTGNKVPVMYLPLGTFALAFMYGELGNASHKSQSTITIPIDLIIAIFSRLPAKSIARCRCVSKPCGSILGSSYFRELFSEISSSRPQILFGCEGYGEYRFFLSPQPPSPNENSSPVVVNHHMNFSVDVHSMCPISQPVHGLVCRRLYLKAAGERGISQTAVIFNPSTGQSFILPKLKTKEVRFSVVAKLGYDPIDKQFKVLSMTTGTNNVFMEHQVLALGTGNHSWRKIKCCRPHYCFSNEGICIDGVLNYTASEDKSSYDSMVVCFDVRTEIFSFIQVPEIISVGDWSTTLINYNGKLGLLWFQESSEIVLYILEDAQKREWSKHTYVLPAPWQNMVGDTRLCIVGMTRTNEIVLALLRLTVPFYLFYYNIERKTIVSLEIQGMEACKGWRVFIHLDHVEDLKLM